MKQSVVKEDLGIQGRLEVESVRGGEVGNGRRGEPGVIEIIGEYNESY